MNLNLKNFDVCCRTCLDVDVSQEMFEIFQEGINDNNNINIAKLIKSYTSIQVSTRYFFSCQASIQNNL